VTLKGSGTFLYVRTFNPNFHAEGYGMSRPPGERGRAGKSRSVDGVRVKTAAKGEASGYKKREGARPPDEARRHQRGERPPPDEDDKRQHKGTRTGRNGAGASPKKRSLKKGPIIREA